MDAVNNVNSSDILQQAVHEIESNMKTNTPVSIVNIQDDNAVEFAVQPEPGKLPPMKKRKKIPQEESFYDVPDYSDENEYDEDIPEENDDDILATATDTDIVVEDENMMPTAGTSAINNDEEEEDDGTITFGEDDILHTYKGI